MESEFDPAVRMEETPEAHIVEIDLPGYKREDLKVQVNNGGNLVISGERSAKERTKVGGKSEKVQRGGQRFRKVIGVPQNLNFDGITAKFGDGKLRVSLPLLHVSEQQSQETLPGSGKADQSLQSDVDRSSPAGQQDLRKESAAPAQDDQSARHPEAIRQGEDKEKVTVAAEKSNELLQEKKPEAPQQAEEFVGELPTSTHPQAVSEEPASAPRPESIQLKSKPEVERQPQEIGRPKPGVTPEIRRPLQEKKEETGSADDGKAAEKDDHGGPKLQEDGGPQLQEDGGPKPGVPPEIRGPIEEKKEGASSADEGKAAEKDDHVVGKEGNGDGVGGMVERYIRHQREEKKDDDKCSTWRSDKFPDLTRIRVPASCSSTFSRRGVLIASTVVIVSVGLYMTYKSRSRHHI